MLALFQTFNLKNISSETFPSHLSKTAFPSESPCIHVTQALGSFSVQRNPIALSSTRQTYLSFNYTAMQALRRQGFDLFCPGIILQPKTVSIMLSRGTQIL